ncbi:MAG: HAMP domain-containing sensor histidine kinase [Verrucomicrobiota bacterium]|nr:HAMP domain-containing sensor histidine kinase [Verrucomicrobiota bacterium]
MSVKTSAILKQNAEKIMKLWEERAKKEVLAALHIERLALHNSLHELLDSLVRALDTTLDRSKARLVWERDEASRVGKIHGHVRAKSVNYTMDQMIFEYHILREVIFDVLEEHEQVSIVDREVITCGIEQAVNDAATQFSETLRLVQEAVAATLTHDLRGPITSAKLYAQIIFQNEEGVDAAGRSAASRIINSMERLDSMIHDLLDASVIRAGEKLVLKTEECDLKLIVSDIVDEFNIIYAQRFSLVAESPAIGFWSRSALRRVVENLATNAVKYSSPETPVKITILQSSTTVTVMVHNVGNPIAEENQAGLFQRFRRAKSSDAHTGWGLGLTVVKGVTEAHHGMVKVESSPEKGTTFIVEIPRQIEDSLLKPDEVQRQ